MSFLRKAKREKNKGYKLTSGTGPYFYGAFYRDDKEDGFCLTLNRDKAEENGKLINTLVDTVSKMIKDYEMLPDDIQFEERQDIWNQTKLNIQKFNSICFPNGRVGNYVPDIPFEAIESGMIAATGIDFLTRIGEIQNDNFNGMHFMYDDMKVKTF
jgi:hypothetical protein